MGEANEGLGELSSNDVAYDSDSGVSLDGNEEGAATKVLFENLHSVFMQACKTKNKTAVRSLLGNHIGMMANHRNRNGQSLVSIACENGNFEIVRHLTETNDIEINSKDNEGNTALMHAAQAGHFHILRYLLWSFESVEVDAENHKGMTALMKTAIRGHTYCARILIVSGGVDVEKRDSSRNFTAHQWALLCGFTETAKVIRNTGNAGYRYIQNKLAHDPSQNSKIILAKDMYCNMKRRVKGVFGYQDEFKSSESGTLFYLVDNTTNPNNALWPLHWRTHGRTLPNETQSDNTDESECQSLTRYNSNEKKKVIYKEKDLPSVLCTFPSPVLEKKKKTKTRREPKVKENSDLLKVPIKKDKHSK